MARYKLMAKLPNDEEYEVCRQKKNTKAEVEKWCSDNIAACGLDWRVGFLIKLRGSSIIYQWQCIKSGEEVRI